LVQERVRPNVSALKGVAADQGAVDLSGQGDDGIESIIDRPGQ